MVYAETDKRMTLFERNNFLKSMIILASLAMVLFIIGGYSAYQSIPDVSSQAAFRSQGIIQSYIEDFAEPMAYIPFWTILGAVAYSLISITLIYFFFEKTQSPEIVFFGFFVFSLVFELFRLVIPLKMVFSFPIMYLISATQVLLFGRYFGLFSLFATSVYAAGFDVQKQRNIFFILLLSSLGIALSVPVDSLVWDTSLKMMSGYNFMFSMVELGIMAAAIVTFFISAFTRGSRTYIFIGLGSLMAYAGRNILISSDNWITPVPGLLLLATGTWLICSRLRKEYLWL